MIYLDTSILAAYYLPEKISNKVQSYIQEKAAPIITELTQLELYSALSIRVRTNTLLESDARKIIRIFNSHLADAYYLNKTLNSKHYAKAGDYIAALNLPLKAPDALHLAFASSENLMLVTTDKQLANNASKLGIDCDLLF